MRFNGEAAWRELGQVAGASIDLEDAPAAAATEVVVVIVVREFVSRGITGKLHRDHVAGLDQPFEGTIDRGEPDSRRSTSSGGVDFLGPHRGSRRLEGATDRLPLPRSALVCHEAIMITHSHLNGRLPLRHAGASVRPCLTGVIGSGA